MTGCHLKGMPWTLYGDSHCDILLASSCKICDLPMCNIHSLPYSDKRICEACIALSLPYKTDGDIIGKDSFSDETIRRVERLYLTNTKACKQ